MTIKIKRFLLVVSFAVFSFSINAANYYVDATGGLNTNDGLTPETAWKTIAYVNDKIKDGTIISGDAVRLKCDEIWSNDESFGCEGPGNLWWGARNDSDFIAIPDNFTLEDYGTGNKPQLDGDTQKPIAIKGEIGGEITDNLTIKNIDVSGQDWHQGHTYHINLNNINGITIDGLDGDGHKGGNSSDGHGVLYIRPASGNIEIKNCHLYNWGPNNMPVHNIGEVYALYIAYMSSGSVSIHDNTIHDINADAIQVMKVEVPTKIYNNIWYNCGENAVDIKCSDYIEVYNNEFYRTPDFNGHGGVGGTGWPLINIIPSTEGGGGGSDNNIIRDNLLRDNNGQPAIYVGYVVSGYTNNNNKIYKNLIENCGIHIGTAGVDTEVYHNIFVTSSGSAYYENNNNLGITYNNTFYNNGGKVFSLEYSNAEFINNIIYNNGLLLDLNYGNPVFKYNCWYNTETSSAWIDWKGTIYFASQQTEWRNAGHAGALFANPLFTDPENGDFHLQSTSPAIDSGIDVGLTEDYEGNHIPQGNAPDIGAYEYVDVNQIDNFNYEIINYEAQNILTIYPNPSHGKCIIRLNNNFSSMTMGNKLKIYNIYGGLIEELQLNNGQFIWNSMNTVPNGVYLMRLEGIHNYLGQRLLLIR